MRILETDALTANEEVTGIGLEFSRQNVDQGALTRAIFTQERVDLPRMHHKVHAVQRQGVAEAFADAVSKDDRMNAHLAIRFPQEIGERNLTTDFTDETDLRKRVFAWQRSACMRGARVELWHYRVSRL
jgi:hypothetical protein